MKAIISLIISAIGACLAGMDFSVLYLFVSASLDIYSAIIDRTNR